MAAEGAGHLKSCGETMPRPTETGGCDCDVCTAAQDRAFYPLTLPLTVGPVLFSVAITLGANQVARQDSVTRIAAAIIGPALLAVTVYLSYRFAERLARLLGQTALNVFVRFTSFILLCMGVQITWNGIKTLLKLQF